MNRIKSMPISFIVTIVLLLLLIVLINSAQMTLGRYMSSFGSELGLAFNSKHSPDLSQGEWAVAAGKQTLSINLSNSGDGTDLVKNGSVRIRIYIPEAESLSGVRMDIGASHYTAEILEVPEGTAVHNLYGEGSICRFYGTDGQELSFDFSSSGIDSLNATLSLISNTKIDTTGIEIMVEPINLQGNGGN